MRSLLILVVLLLTRHINFFTDREDLSANILHHLVPVIIDLKERAFYRVVKDALSERNIIIHINDEEGQHTTKEQDNSDQIILQLVATVIEKGRNAMLNFIDILHKFDHEKLANDLLYSVPNEIRGKKCVLNLYCIDQNVVYAFKLLFLRICKVLFVHMQT